MDSTHGRRGIGGARRALRVMGLALALSVLPPLKIIATPAGATEPAIPSISWQAEFAEAGPINVVELRYLPSSQNDDPDPADWRIRAGFILLLLSALGTVTVKLWAGAFRRTS